MDNLDCIDNVLDDVATDIEIKAEDLMHLLTQAARNAQPQQSAYDAGVIRGLLDAANMVRNRMAGTEVDGSRPPKGPLAYKAVTEYEYQL